jgi:VCBS repeat-containing protein
MGHSTTYTATGSTTDSYSGSGVLFIQVPVSYSTSNFGAATVTSFDVGLSSQSGNDVLSIQNHSSTWDNNTENVTVSGNQVSVNGTVYGTYNFANQDLIFTFSSGNSNPDTIGAIMDAVAYQNTASVRLAAQTETVSWSFSPSGTAAPSDTINIAALPPTTTYTGVNHTGATNAGSNVVTATGSNPVVFVEDYQVQGGAVPLTYSVTNAAAAVTSFDANLDPLAGSAQFDSLSIQNRTTTWDGNSESVTTSGDQVYVNNTLAGTYSFSGHDLVFTFVSANSNPDTLGAILDAVAFQSTGAGTEAGQNAIVSFSFTSNGVVTAPSTWLSVPVPPTVAFAPAVTTIATYAGVPVSIQPGLVSGAGEQTFTSAEGGDTFHELFAETIGLKVSIVNPHAGDELLYSGPSVIGTPGNPSAGDAGDTVASITGSGTTTISLIYNMPQFLASTAGSDFATLMAAIQYENTSAAPPSSAQIQVSFQGLQTEDGTNSAGFGPVPLLEFEPVVTSDPLLTVNLTPRPSVVTETATVTTAGAVSGTAGITGTGALAGDSDANAGYTLSVSAVTGGTLGSALQGIYGDLTLNADGSFSYTAGATSTEIAAIAAATGQVTDAFTFSVSDGHGGVTPSTLDIKLDATPPNATSVQFAFGGNDLAVGAQGKITLAVSDIGALGTAGGSPTLTLNDGGTATYDAAASTLTSLVFDYQVAGSDSNVAALGVSALNLGGATVTNSSGVPVDDISVAGLTGSGPQIDTTNSVSSGTIALGGFSTSDSIYDSQTVAPFAAIAVSDSLGNAQDSATIAFAAANGTLSGAGLSGGVVSNGTVTYSLSATTPESLQAKLRALVFTPTAQPTAGGAVTTSFDLTVTDVPTASAMPIVNLTLSDAIPYAIATDAAGDFFVTDGVSSVEEFSSSGALLRTLSTGNHPVSLATDAAGDVFVANEFSFTVEKFSSSGTLLMTLDTGAGGPFSIGADAAGDVLVVIGGGQQALELFSSSGAPETAPISDDYETTVASFGNDILYLSPAATGVNPGSLGIYLISEPGGPATLLTNSAGAETFAVSSDGDVYFVTLDHNIYESTVTGSSFSAAQPFVSGADHLGPIAVDPFGDVYAASGDIDPVDPTTYGNSPQQVDEFSSSGALLRTLSIGYAYVLSLTTDQAGDVFVGTSNDQVLEFAPLGASTVSDSTTTVTVTPAVTALAETATVASGGAVSGTAGTTGTGALAGDSDATGYGLSVSAIAGGTLGAAMHGTYGDLTLNADGSFSYAADATSAEATNIAAASGPVTDAFTYSVGDGHGGVTSSTLDIKLDAAKPSITAIGFSPSSGELALNASGTITLGLGDTGSIDITGNGPTLTLNDGGTATYDAAASTSTSLVFDYTVLPTDTDVASLAVNSVNLNGATLTNASGVATATSLSVSGVTQSGPKIDLLRVSGGFAAPSSGTYGAGETMALFVQFNKAVTVTGSGITLSLNDGGTATLDVADTALLQQNGYVVFDYRVAPTDHDVTGLAVTGGTLNGGTILDSLGDEAQFTGALPTFSNIEIDTGVACYCGGTLIEIARGQKKVEALQIGDKVRTASGKLRPIKWIGRRSYAGRFVMGRKDILPVCFKAGALADNVPARDLWVSPNHAMYFSVANVASVGWVERSETHRPAARLSDGFRKGSERSETHRPAARLSDGFRKGSTHPTGLLIEAKDLINGVSIVQAERVESVEYFHIELDSHDVIVAEGALAESFIDDDSRAMFHNAHDYATRYADEDAAPAHYCAPRLDEGYGVEAVRQRLAQRAGLLGVAEAPQLGALRGHIDRVRAGSIAGWAQNTDAPEAPVCLDILAEGKVIGRVLANGYRDDLKRAGLGSGHHAFAFVPPPGVALDSIEVRRSLDGASLGSSRGTPVRHAA